MPSTSLTFWTGSRKASLNAIDAQCANSVAVVPANPLLAEENVRGYGLLLSAHFQGFCRDLYTEASQIVASKVRPTLRPVIQRQFAFQSMLDRGNPTNDNIKKDFGRFGFSLNFAEIDPTNAPRLQHLSSLNDWRNIAAHHGYVSVGDIPSLADLRAWRNSCDGLAASLDVVVYNRLRALLRRGPWAA